MLTDQIVPAEGARYAASLVLLPGLWAGPDTARNFATYLAHRGWQCHLLDLRGAGTVAARTAAVTEYLGGLGSPAVLVGHDAGGLVAAAVAHGSTAAVAAVVLLAPLVPGGAGVRALALGLRSLPRLALGWPLPPPGGSAALLAWGDLPSPIREEILRRLAPDDGAAVRDLLRGRVALGRLGVPALVVAGGRDPLLGAGAAGELAARLGGEVGLLENAGHWLLAGPMWQQTVALVHRWLVQRLGEPLLELYAETMAERDADEE